MEWGRCRVQSLVRDKEGIRRIPPSETKKDSRSCNQRLPWILFQVAPTVTVRSRSDHIIEI